MDSTLQLLEARDLVTRAARSYCTTDKNGVKHCKKESFFHRVGRWILTAVLIFFGLIALMIVCCCIRRRRSKKAKVAPAGYQYGYPRPPTPAAVSRPPVDSKPAQVNGVTSQPGQGAAAAYYNGH